MDISDRGLGIMRDDLSLCAYLREGDRGLGKAGFSVERGRFGGAGGEGISM